MPEPIRELPTDESNRRQHYRVEYPVSDRPVFTAGKLRGMVSDCSETGVRVFLSAGLPADDSVLVGDRITATLLFARGEREEVEGVIARYDGGTMVVRLDTVQLPFGRILREQWWLRARYPWRDKK